jgi:hypothetical protein
MVYTLIIHRANESQPPRAREWPVNWRKNMTEDIYTVGSIISDVARPQRARPLYRNDKEVAIVSSDWGPAVLGEMSEEEARERWPEAFED